MKSKGFIGLFFLAMIPVSWGASLEIDAGATHNLTATSIALSSSGEILAAALESRITIYRLSDWKILKTWETNQQNIIRLSFSPDANFLLSVGMLGQDAPEDFDPTDHSFMLWQTETGQSILDRPVEWKHGPGLPILFSNVSLGWGNTHLDRDSNNLEIKRYFLEVLDLRQRTVVMDIELDFEPNALGFSSDGSLLAIANRNQLKFLPVRPETPVLRGNDVDEIRLDRHTDPISLLAFSPEGRWISSAGGGTSSSDIEPRFWDTAHDGMLLWKGEMILKEPISFAEFTDDGRAFVTQQGDHFCLYEVRFTKHYSRNLGCSQKLDTPSSPTLARRTGKIAVLTRKNLKVQFLQIFAK